MPKYTDHGFAPSVIDEAVLVLKPKAPPQVVRDRWPSGRKPRRHVARLAILEQRARQWEKEEFDRRFLLRLQLNEVIREDKYFIEAVAAANHWAAKRIMLRSEGVLSPAWDKTIEFNSAVDRAARNAYRVAVLFKREKESQLRQYTGRL